MGRAFCLGLLDLIECNPVSRLPLSTHKTLEGVRQDILAHNRIIIPKAAVREDSVQRTGRSGIVKSSANIIMKPKNLIRFQSNLAEKRQESQIISKKAFIKRGASSKVDTLSNEDETGPIEGWNEDKIIITKMKAKPLEVC